MKDSGLISDLDVFFFYGQNDLQLEIESDITAGLIQGRRSLFYNRRDSAGIDSKENYPNSLSLNVLLRFDVVNWIAYRNTYVTDGSNNEKDRRVGVSQNFISFVSDASGNLDVQILYIPFYDFDKKDVVSIPVGGQ